MIGANLHMMSTWLGALVLICPGKMVNYEILA